MKPASPLAPLRSPAFAAVWSAAFFSNIGTWMRLATVPYFLDHLTHSPAWVGLGGFCTIFPLVAISPIAGSWVDRYSRRAVVLFAHLALLVTSLALWLVALADDPSPVLFLAIVVLSGLATGVMHVSWQAFFIPLVPREHMLGAVRLSMTQQFASRAIGPAIAGVVLAEFGAAQAFLANAVSFVPLLLVMGSVRMPPVPRTQGLSVLEEVRSGWRYLVSRRTLVVATILVFGFGVGAQPMLQLVEPVTRALGVDAGRYGALVACYGAAAVVGSVIVLSVSHRVARSTLSMVGMVCGAAGVLLIGAAPGYGLALVGMGLVGMATVLTMMPMMTTVQDNVEESYRGRVMSLVLMTSSLGQAMGSLGGGAVAAQVSIRWTVIGMGALLLLFVGVTIARLERYRPLDYTPSFASEPSVAAQAGLSGIDLSTRPEVFPA